MECLRETQREWNVSVVCLIYHSQTEDSLNPKSFSTSALQTSEEVFIYQRFISHLPSFTPAWRACHELQQVNGFKKPHGCHSPGMSFSLQIHIPLRTSELAALCVLKVICSVHGQCLRYFLSPPCTPNSVTPGIRRIFLPQQNLD